MSEPKEDYDFSAVDYELLKDDYEALKVDLQNMEARYDRLRKAAEAVREWGGDMGVKAIDDLCAVLTEEK